MYVFTLAGRGRRQGRQEDRNRHCWARHANLCQPCGLVGKLVLLVCVPIVIVSLIVSCVVPHSHPTLAPALWPSLDPGTEHLDPHWAGMERQGLITLQHGQDLMERRDWEDRWGNLVWPCWHCTDYLLEPCYRPTFPHCVPMTTVSISGDRNRTQPQPTDDNTFPVFIVLCV